MQVSVLLLVNDRTEEERQRERENYMFFLRIKSDIILTAPFLAMIADYWKKLMVGIIEKR